jgi:hypothetical protein
LYDESGNAKKWLEEALGVLALEAAEQEDVASVELLGEDLGAIMRKS